MAFASLTIDLNARIANIERDMGRAAHVAEKQSQRISAAFAKVGQATAFLGGALGVGAFGGFIKSSIDAADNLNDLSKKTGIAVDDLAGLQLVVDKSGTSMDMLGNGIGKLNKYMGEAAQGNKAPQSTQSSKSRATRPSVTARWMPIAEDCDTTKERACCSVPQVAGLVGEP